MKKTFYNLDEEKKKRIIDSCIEEFSRNSFEKASTNNIIKAAGISKGSLFKYTNSKEELFEYVLSQVLEELINYQISNIDKSKTDIIERLKDIINNGLEFYEHNPIKYKFAIRAFFDGNDRIRLKVQKIRNDIIRKYREAQLEGIDWNQYSIPPKEVLNILDIVLSGINVRMLAMINEELNFEKFKKLITNDIDGVFNCIGKGIRGGE
ncbi:TetR/AcrR family transcriptional regulator [Oceanirhabdus sp. W0125-5]|uniref:TetR/AcrR family transcriptional regulator n=1 Tax=Oceanirhabdus sp. W0125-5 TaxID=2999116 RepID=UPI0022F2FA19|nr:TetR/AcrR family transcriptional regulator [Oceanirhabdus sp. W0125-5]WBW97716.1 TetR/AcrR family transcriptional regulator [Oceanirhabdus sp. W0125-5]